MKQDGGAAKKKILVFCDSYLPSIQSGGGMWTVVNIVDRFCDRYDFFVVTRNYDGKGDRRPFTSVKTGEWNSVGNAQVHYLASENVTRATCKKMVDDVRPDVVLLNSSMSGPCMKFLLARRQGMIERTLPVVLAATGELSDGCLADKTMKKKMYLAAARAYGLFDGIIWKASTDLEVDEIRNRADENASVMVAADLTPKTILPEYDAAKKLVKAVGEVKLIFYSRIVPKKNLHFLLNVLENITEGSIRLDIVGPFEDRSYWRECEPAIKKLPANISVNVAGPVAYHDGLAHLFESHFFVLPTLNENFGYVFIESMAAGTPVLASENVVWTDWEANNAGVRVPLADPTAWKRQIENYMAMGPDEYRRTSDAARRYALGWLARTEAEQANALVFERAFTTR